MVRNYAFLIGAGASKGAGGIAPYDPPLGAELYGVLKREFPTSWGALSNNLDVLFRDNFETGMAELWDSQLDIGSRLIIEMAIYFSRFDPPLDGSDCYTRLIWRLKQSGLVPHTRIATLNYECVLDVAASRLGLKLTYLSDTVLPNNITIWKPHGACNLIPNAQVYHLSIVAKGIYDGPLRAVDLPEVRRLYDSGYALPPAMSLFAPGKPTPVARTWVDQTRRQWAEWAQGADVVVVIGARPLLEDAHIWEPIIDSSAEVWYIGGTSDSNYQTFQSQLGHRITHLADRFVQGFGPLARRLRTG
jgi:hypothetical protein